MTDKEKLEKIRSEVIWYIHLRNEGLIIGSCGDFEKLLKFIDSLQEEPVSVWHDANQQPTMFAKYLVRYSDGRVGGSWERHDDGFIPWKDVVKEHGFTHWCYVEDLLKL